MGFANLEGSLECAACDAGSRSSGGEPPFWILQGIWIPGGAGDVVGVGTSIAFIPWLSGLPPIVLGIWLGDVRVGLGPGGGITGCLWRSSPVVGAGAAISFVLGIAALEGGRCGWLCWEGSGDVTKVGTIVAGDVQPSGFKY